jgi:hypothetical protein
VTEKVKTITSESSDKNPEYTINKKGQITISWPNRGKEPLSEFTTRHFFTLAFPVLFPYGTGDVHVNRSRTCTSLGDWANHLLWYRDGRFANHIFFKFVAHNMIMRKRVLENSTFIVKQKLGDDLLSIAEPKEKLKNGGKSIAKKILYFSAILRGTS